MHLTDNAKSIGATMSTKGSAATRPRFKIVRNIFVASKEDSRGSPVPIETAWVYRLVDCDTGINVGEPTSDPSEIVSRYIELNEPI